MHNTDLILTLAVSLTAALVLGYLTQRLGLSPIVGYLFAGIVVGPHTPGPIADRQMAEQLSEIGVVLLMFGVGLHFHPAQLLAVRRVALPGAIGQSFAATGLGVLVAVAFGWGLAAGFVYGLAISVASTVVLTRVLSDNNDLHTPAGHIAVGWLVVEDLFTVLVLVVLPAVFAHRSAGMVHLPMVMAAAVVRIAVLAALIFVVGGRLIPWLLERVVATRSRELFTLSVLVMALGIAVGSAKLFGVSMALGAFLAGMAVGRTDFSLRAASEALPMRDAFAVLFFVAVGMLFDPRFLFQSPVVVAITLAIIVLGKPLAALAIVLLLGYPIHTALVVAVALAQIGEFSFILAALGKSLNIVSPEILSVLVAAAMISIAINPLIYRLVDPLDAWASRRFRTWRWLNFRGGQVAVPLAQSLSERAAQKSPRHRAVIVGYGPVGQTLVRLLRENQIEPTVIELNLGTVRRLHEERIAAVYGDAALAETLKSAGVDRANTLILSAAGLRTSGQIIRFAREINPIIRVLVRAEFVQETPSLRQAGADRIFSGEAEVALAMTESVLRDLGATPDQIDRERQRLHRDLRG